MNLREYRQSLGMTLKDLADIFDVSFQTISKWETGRRHPDGGMLVQIAEWSDGAVDISSLVPDGQRWRAEKDSKGDWTVIQSFKEF